MPNIPIAVAMKQGLTTGDVVFVKKAFQRGSRVELEHAPQRGRSFVSILIGDVKDGEEGSFDPVHALNELGWHFDPDKAKG